MAGESGNSAAIWALWVGYSDRKAEWEADADNMGEDLAEDRVDTESHTIVTEGSGDSDGGRDTVVCRRVLVHEEGAGAVDSNTLAVSCRDGQTCLRGHESPQGCSSSSRSCHGNCGKARIVVGGSSLQLLLKNVHASDSPRVALCRLNSSHEDCLSCKARTKHEYDYGAVWSLVEGKVARQDGRAWN